MAVWTQNQFFLLLTPPQGSQGCQKMCQDPLNLILEVWYTNIHPKLKELQKTVKIEKKIIKKPCFLTVSQRLCNLGSILAHQTSKFKFSQILAHLLTPLMCQIWFDGFLDGLLPPNFCDGNESSRMAMSTTPQFIFEWTLPSKNFHYSKNHPKCVK